jgi:DNA (cytosine-5)-methyltransferase 1
MYEGLLPTAPIWDDVRTFDGTPWRGAVDIIYGGFPCQDISVAGLGKGLEGRRSGLFYEVARLAEEVQPSCIFLENVPAIRTRGLRAVGEELARLGYDARGDIGAAAEVGAPHLRKRWFLLAHSKCEQLRDKQGRWSRTSREGTTKPRDYGEAELVADSEREGLEGRRSERELGRRSSKEQVIGSSESAIVGNRWPTEPNVGRVADGVTFRVDRIKALGNGVVPSQAREAFVRLLNSTSQCAD